LQVYSPRNWTTYKIEFDSLIEWGHDACDKLLASKHIDKLMEINQNHKFDVLITEFFNTDCSLGIAYKMNITKFIGMVRI
jgi:glucuronosyltransferase